MYSQYGQDDFVATLLHGKREGYFLDTGAADGIRSSNTLLFERTYGWRGLCVEPEPSYFAALIRNRRCTCLNACLWDQDCEVQFVSDAFTLGGVIDDFSTKQIAWTARVNSLPLDDAGRPPLTIMQATTLRQALRRARAPAVIDYWSLDVEGSELRLLRSFPFDAYTFNVITVEHNRLPVRAEIRNLLHARGFEFVGVLEIDDCYIRREAFPSLHTASRVWKHRRPF